MSPLGAYLGVMVAAGIPVWIHGSSPVAAFSVLGAALLWIAVARRSLGAGLAGALGATAALGVALWQQPAASVLEALAFGTALLLALQHADFARRFHGAEVAPAVAAAAFRRWLAAGGLAAAAIVVLTAAVTVVTDGAPAAYRPLLAGIGAFLAIGAAVAVFARGR